MSGAAKELVPATAGQKRACDALFEAINGFPTDDAIYAVEELARGILSALSEDEAHYFANVGDFAATLARVGRVQGGVEVAKTAGRNALAEASNG